MPREDEGSQTGSICRAYFAGGCEYGDSCIFSHALVPQGPKRETIGSRAARALGIGSDRSDTNSSHGSSSSSYGHGSSSRGRSWADQSQDTWPEVHLPPSGGTAASVQHQALPPGFEVSGWQLPSFGNRLGFPEFFPSAHPPGQGAERASQSKSARRRKQRELADRRSEFRDLNMERADRAVAAAAALKPDSGGARPPRHLEFPRSENESPLRPLAPWPTPRPDPQKGRASDGARGASEQEEEDEDEELQEPQPRPACPGRRRNILSL